MALHEELNSPMRCLVRNKTTSHIYAYQGSNRWRNLTTGDEGTATPEQAKQSFTIPLNLNNMAAANPLLTQLITTLGLAIDTND